MHRRKLNVTHGGSMPALAGMLLLPTLLAAVLTVTGCTGGFVPDNIPNPVISSLSPASATAGGPSFTLTVNGSGFTTFSEVNWNGGQRNTTFVSASQLKAVISLLDIAAVGSASVTVVNASNTTDRTVTSNSVSFPITLGAAPIITSISPTSAAVGGPAFTLTVNGTGFVSASVVNWSGSPRPTTFVSATQLTAAIPASDLDHSGPITASVTVVNPPSNGGPSNAVSFAITSSFQIVTASPLPAGTMNSPYSATLQATGGVGALTWSLTSGSLPTGLSLNTSTGVISGTPTQAGSFTFTVQVQDTTSQKPSKAFSLDINSLVPAITSVSPTSAVSGGVGFPLTVNGTGFVSTSAVNWNGSSRSTTFVNATQLTAFIRQDDIAAPGSATITVVNPPPGGGTSNPVSFTVTSGQTVGVVSIISQANDGSPANALPSSDLALSHSGRFAAFQNENATNLVSNPVVSQHFDMYFHDSCVGFPASACSPVTQLASGLNGSSGNGGFDGNGPSFGLFSSTVSISADGSFVSFLSRATNLATPTIAKFSQAYVRDTLGSETGMVSLRDDGTEPNGAADEAELSANGRWVAFTSLGTDLVAGVTTPGEAYIRFNCVRRPTPCQASTVLVSVDNSGTASSGAGGVAVSANGRFVSFAGGFASFPNAPNGGAFVRDTCIGAVGACTPSTKIVSVNSDGGPAGLGLFFGATSISDDGRFVAFASQNVLVPGASAALPNLYVHDTCRTEDGPVPSCTESTITVYMASGGGTANNPFDAQSLNAHMLSGTGRFLVFASPATNLVPGGTPPGTGIFVRDTCNGVPSGCTPTTVLVSLDSTGNFVQGSLPVISSDGHYCAFIEGLGGPFVEQAVLARTGF